MGLKKTRFCHCGGELHYKYKSYFNKVSRPVWCCEKCNERYAIVNAAPVLMPRFSEEERKQMRADANRKRGKNTFKCDCGGHTKQLSQSDSYRYVQCLDCSKKYKLTMDYQKADYKAEPLPKCGCGGSYRAKHYTIVDGFSRLIYVCGSCDDRKYKIGDKFFEYTPQRERKAVEKKTEEVKIKIKKEKPKEEKKAAKIKPEHKPAMIVSDRAKIRWRVEDLKFNRSNDPLFA